jgi:7-cyano-7-deazaguanine synthase in queuosine biosynthesis
MIPFECDWNRIAVSVSGGADSAMLAYLLCKKVTKQEVHIISHIRCWKTKPWQEHDAKNVYNWLVDRFPNITFKRHVNFIAPDLEYGDQGPIVTDEYGKRVSGDNAEQRGFAEYICHHNDIDAYYNGVTKNPEDVAGGMKERSIEPTADNEHLFKMKHMGRWAIHPFRFITKDVIIKKYKEENIVDLFNITRSCEGTFDWLDYTNYKPGELVPACNECFWCKERDWAVDKAKDEE